MADITPAMIKELRERTGVGVGKCKEALETAKGNMDLAIDNLRKAGMASAVKKEGRETKEGMIGIAETHDRIAIVEVNAETDFVVKNDMFRTFLTNVAEEAAKSNPSSLESFMNQKYSKEPSLTIDQFRATMVQTIGENIQVKRVLILQKGTNNSIGVYSHLNGKIVTFVDIAGSNGEVALAKDIAMHVAAAAPDYLTLEKIPQNVIEHEKEIARGQVQGKAEQILEKIVDGKINSFYTAVCLDRQPYIRDDKITIGELVNKRAKETGKQLKLANFARWSVGQA